MPRLHCPEPLAKGWNSPAAGRRAPRAGAAAAARRPADPVRRPRRRVRRHHRAHGPQRRPRAGRQPRAIEREPARAVHLAVGMPANDRMDWLVEKAAELGVAQPPAAAGRAQRAAPGKASGRRRSRRTGRRRRSPPASSAAATACRRCTRCGAARELAAGQGADRGWCCRCAPAQARWRTCSPAHDPVTLLSGPEGGLSPREEDAARRAAGVPCTSARACCAPTPPRSRRWPLLTLGAAGAPDEPQSVAAGRLPGPLPHQQRRVHRHQRPGRACRWRRMAGWRRCR
jgi:hypothetical protein